LKPRLDVAKRDIDDMLKPVVRRDAKSIKELAKSALDRLKPEDEIPKLARKVLDKHEKNLDDSVPTLAKNALERVGDEIKSDSVPELAKKANKKIENSVEEEKEEITELANKALSNFQKLSPKE